MKQLKLLLFLFLCLSIFSCGNDNMTTSAEEGGKGIQVTVTEKEPSYNPSFEKQIKTMLPYTGTFPDTEKKARDFKIDCPEGYYLYCIPGQYMDAEEQLITLEFVDEYVLTSKEVTKEKLIQDVRDSVPSETGDPNRRGPGYILFFFNVFHQDYLPVECLYESVLKNSDEYRYTENDLICELGVSAWTKVTGNDEDYYISLNPYDSEEGAENNVRIEEKDWPVDEVLDQIYGLSQSNGILYENEGGPAAYQQDLLMYGEKPLFRGYTASVYKKYNNSSGGRYVPDADCSVFNNEWWNLYQSAVKELTEVKEQYVYPEINAEFKRTSKEKLEEDLEPYEKDLETGWYLDPEKDREIRACIYANLNIREKAELENVIIFLKDLENGHRLYYAGIYNPEERTVRMVDKGADVITGTDLTFLAEKEGN